MAKKSVAGYFLALVLLVISIRFIISIKAGQLKAKKSRKRLVCVTFTGDPYGN